MLVERSACRHVGRRGRARLPKIHGLRTRETLGSSRVLFECHSEMSGATMCSKNCIIVHAYVSVGRTIQLLLLLAVSSYRFYDLVWFGTLILYNTVAFHEVSSRVIEISRFGRFFAHKYYFQHYYPERWEGRAIASYGDSSRLTLTASLLKVKP